jgi:hypothetical protein
MAFGNTYKGIYKLRNPEKYAGDPKNVVYRSMWERNAFRWCDMNKTIKHWHSEETVIPYMDESTDKVRRYFMDLMIEWQNGRVLLVEIKPHGQTVKPKKKGRQTKRYVNEVMTYVKNQSKWKAAAEFAHKKGWTFQIWTERELKKLGILKW